MFDIFGPRLTRKTYPPRRVECTAWAGHSYRTTPGGKRLYCPTCGHVINLDEES